MRKLNKTAAFGILAAALAAGTLSGCSKAIDGTKTVATVGDEKVTLGLASYMVRDQQAQTMSYYNMLMSQYGVSGSASNVWDQKGDDGKTVGESSKDGVMTTINQLYVLKAHAADYDVTITDDEEKAIKEAAAVLESQGAKYRNLSIDSASAAGKYASDIMAFPTTILVDRNGNIVGEPMLGGIDNQENYDTLMKQIQSVIDADSAK